MEAKNPRISGHLAHVGYKSSNSPNLSRFVFFKIFACGAIRVGIQFANQFALGRGDS